VEGNSGVFIVKSYYDKLLTGEEANFPHLSVWIPGLPRKACLKLASSEGVILRGQNLRKRKISCVS